MKELSVEEKARRYDVAIKKAESLYKAAEPMSGCNVIIETLFSELTESEDEVKPNGGIVMEDFNESNGFYKVNLAYLNKEQVEEIEDLVKKWNPELAESEDERIRKEMLDYLKLKIKNTTIPFSLRNAKKWINWLEKQGEKKSEKWDVVAIAKLADEYYDTLIKESNMSYNMATHCKLAFFHGATDILEKLQCEQELWNEEDKNMLKWIIGYLDNKMLNTSIVEERTACKNAIVWLEKLEDEQKPVEPKTTGYWNVQDIDDKVEPKFHEGEWVVYDHRPYQVVELPKEGYINLRLRGNGKIEFAPSTYCRHWTIQDAKDGDVLVDRYGNIGIFEKTFGFDWHSYCYLGCNGDFMYNEVGGSHDLADTYPATKDQRDLLFQKMKEAGYTWDAEKKELNKIEQKPAWSEDYEKVTKWVIDYIGNCPNGSFDFYGGVGKEAVLSWLNKLKDRVLSQPKQEWSEEDERKCNNIIALIEGKTIMRKDIKGLINWLKSLRPQNRWKPSDEQIEALDDVISSRDIKYDVLSELWKDLKKLKEE